MPDMTKCPVVDMCVIDGELWIRLKRREDLIAIRNGLITGIDLDGAYAYRFILYDWQGLSAAFWGPKYNKIPVAEFRRKFRKEYPAVRFTYSAYLGDIGEACTMLSPKWDHAGDLIHLEWGTCP